MFLWRRDGFHRGNLVPSGRARKSRAIFQTTRKLDVPGPCSISLSYQESSTDAWITYFPPPPFFPVHSKYVCSLVKRCEHRLKGFTNDFRSKHLLDGWKIQWERRRLSWLGWTESDPKLAQMVATSLLDYLASSMHRTVRVRPSCPARQSP